MGCKKGDTGMESNKLINEQAPITAEQILSGMYERVVNEWSDIQEHIPTLRDYASRSTSILECGVRSAVSTWGFMKGLYESEYPIKKLVGVDLHDHPNVSAIKELASSLGIDYTFWQGDDLKYPLSANDEFDIVFIDTWHVHAQLSRELEKFAPVTKKWFILHDTTVDEYIGESIRNGWDVKRQAEETGYSVESITIGLWPAITEFLVHNPEFELEKRYTNCNGLTILRRKG